MTKPTLVLYEIHPRILGGTEHFLVRFIGRLDRRRYEPIVISQKRGKPLQMIHSMGIRTEVVADYFKASGIQQLAGFIRRNGIGLCQSNYYSSSLAMASNLAEVPHIWRLGGHLDAGGVRTRRDAQSALDIIRLLSKVIICNSNYVRSQFRGRAGAPHIHVIPNGIPAPARLSGKKGDGNFHIGMIAHLTPQKRHMDFIRAAELVCESRDDVSFSMLGSPIASSANGKYATQVQRQARSLQRQGKLSISEFFKSGDEVPGKFDIIVLPSVRESFSNAILEAMAAGIPVIAARSGGNPELVEHRKTGLLVPPLRPEALARAILLLIKDTELIGRMGQAARERARTRFSMEDCVKSYEAVYSEVASGLS